MNADTIREALATIEARKTHILRKLKDSDPDELRVRLDDCRMNAHSAREWARISGSAADDDSADWDAEGNRIERRLSVRARLLTPAGVKALRREVLDIDDEARRMTRYLDALGRPGRDGTLSLCAARQ